MKFKTQKNFTFQNSHNIQFNYSIIYIFIFYNTIILIAFLPIISSSNSIKIKLNVDNEGEIPLVKSKDGRRPCPSRLSYSNVNFINNDNKCKLNLNAGEHSIVVEWDNPIEDCSNMFEGINSLIEINLTEFDSSKIKYMGFMFKDCKSLKKVILPSISNENQLEHLENMFENCYSLETVIFNGDFKTNSVSSMAWMFKNCYNLYSIIFPDNFKTNNVEYFQDMFYNCSNLTSLNLSNFDWSKVKNMKNMENMFYYNNKLQYIDLGNNEIGDNFNNLFRCGNNKMVIYINKKNPEEFFKYTNNTFAIVECGNNTLENIMNSYTESKIVCIPTCENLSNYRFKYINRCYESYPETTSYIYESNDTPHLQTTFQEKIPINIPSSLPKISVISTTVISEKNEKEINETDLKGIKITETGNDLIVTNLQNIKTEIKTSIININSLELEKEMLKSDSKEIKTEKINEVIETKYNQIETEKGIIKTDINIITNCDINEFFSGKCKNVNQNNDDKNTFNQNIINNIMNGNLNEIISEIVKDNKVILIEEPDEKYQLSTISAQKYLENLTSINFGECENKLKANYSLNQSEELIIFKIEHTIKGINIPIIDYAIFNNNGSILIDPSICNDLLVEYSTPVSLDSNEIYKYDTSSDYYSDICKQYSNGEVDMTIYERKNEYNEKNMSLCEYNCTYIRYVINTSKVECKCPLKNELLNYNNTSNKQLLNKVEATKKISNFDVTQCINLFKAKDRIKKILVFIYFFLS